MGVTLKTCVVHTTNHNWEKSFFDRTTRDNQEKPLFKVLSIEKFGVYWKTKESYFIARDYEAIEDRLD